MLHITGKKLDLDAALKSLPVKPSQTLRRGTLLPALCPSRPAKRRLRSSLSIVASRADFDQPKKQVTDATRFLRKHTAGLRRVCRRSDVDDARLDFGIYKRDAFMQAEHFSLELIELMGKIGLSLEISLYNDPENQCAPT